MLLKKLVHPFCGFYITETYRGEREEVRQGQVPYENEVNVLYLETFSSLLKGIDDKGK